MDWAVLKSNWKLWQSIAYAVIAAVLFDFAISGSPIQRPLHFFIGAGVVLTIPIAQRFGAIGGPSNLEIPVTLGSLLLTSWMLFFSLWERVPAAGSDMINHLAIRAGYIYKTGYINPNLGMYTYSPFIHITYATHALITDLWIFEARFALVIISALTPLLVFVVCRQAWDFDAGVYGMSLATGFPLLFRIGASFDSETLAIPLFLLTIYLSVKWVSEHDHRHKLLLMGTLITGSYIHFLYPMILGAVLFSGIFLAAAFSQNFSYVTPLQTKETPTFVLFIASLFIFWRVLWSEIGRQMVFSLGVSGADPSIPSNPIVLFLPTSGAVGRSTASAGASGGSGHISTVINFAPMLLIILLGALGAVVLISRVRSDQTAPILIGVGCCVAFFTLVGLIAFSGSSSFRLGFRLYYFAGVFGVICGSIAVRYLLEPSISPLVTGSKVIITILLVFALTTTGPLSSLGNSVDSRFGGQALYTSKSDVQQLSALDSHTADGPNVAPVTIDRVELYQKIGPIGPTYGERGSRVISSPGECARNSSVWTSGRFSYCIK